MCFPAIGAALGATAGTAAATNLGIAATSAALGAVSSGLQFAGQRQQAKQQAEFQRQSIAVAQKKAQMQGTAAILERQQQEKAVAQEKGRAAKAGEAIVSRAGVAALESGVSGLSVQALMDDYVRQQAGQVAALTSQDKLYALRHGLNLQQLAMASEQEILGLSKPISKPSALSLALNVGSSALGAYGTYKTLQAASKPTFSTEGKSMGWGRYQDFQPL